MMKNCSEICEKLRKNFFGEDATAKDYKDSYIINYTIEIFSDYREKLMDKSITKLDKSDTKVTKTLTLRSDCYEKLKEITKFLSTATGVNITEAETLRRILYYCVENIDDLGETATRKKKSLKIFEMQTKLLLLKTYVYECESTIQTLLEELEDLENDDYD